MKSLEPKDISTKDLHGYLLSAVSPRPIGFISTVDKEGIPNLSPFSFFNVFSANPPILIFSPARRVRDNTVKDTLVNCIETKQAVVNMVDYKMVQQMSLSSSEYSSEIDEFVKAGFTALKSDLVSPPRVGEAPVQFECVIEEVKALGSEGGAGNLILAKVVKLHINEEILNEQGGIDPLKLDVVSRMGGAYYSRALEGAFTIPKPLTHLGVGFDALPLEIKESEVLTGNELALLAGVSQIPDFDTVDKFIKENQIPIMKESVKKHKFASELLKEHKITAAWCVLLQK